LKKQHLIDDPEPRYEPTEDALVFAGISFRGMTREHLRPGGSGLKLVFPVNAELILLANRNVQFREVLSRHFSTFDGFWPYLLAKLRTGRQIEKVSGSEFVHELFEYAAREGLKMFFLGAMPNINKAAREKVKSRYGIEVDGYSPEFNQPLQQPETVDAIFKEIRQSRPQLLLIALGAPRQELWLDEHRAGLEAAGVEFAMAVGGTLDMIAGVYRKAPRLVRASGLEGIWRVLLDPKRIKRFPNPIHFLRVVLRG
jgi:N-acetylglucosaminyldiphosphoundecaprenol N-acetyl-beta-D-mannosaminyltransferase